MSSAMKGFTQIRLRQRMRKQLDEERNALFRALCKREHIPEPTREFKFAWPDRKWAFDFSWPQSRVALEVEGGIFTRQAHGSISGILRDIEKYNAAALRGWLVFRCTPETLDTLATVHMIKSALAL